MITDMQTCDAEYTVARVERVFHWRNGIMFVATHKYDKYDGMKSVKVTLININNEIEAKKYIARIKLVEAL